MSSLIRIDTTVTPTAAQMTARLRPTAGQSPFSIQRVADQVIEPIAGGVLGGRVTINVGAVQATGTIVLGTNPSANDTVTILNETVTFVSSGATGLQVNIGASNSATAASLNTLINSDSHFTGKVSSAVASHTCTLTAAVAGVMGNGLALAISSSGNSVTAFTGGSDGTQTAMYNGM